jgi:hypothetical protein
LWDDLQAHNVYPAKFRENPSTASAVQSRKIRGDLISVFLRREGKQTEASVETSTWNGAMITRRVRASLQTNKQTNSVI